MKLREKHGMALLFILLLLAGFIWFLSEQNTVLMKHVYRLEKNWIFSVNGEQTESQPAAELAAFVLPQNRKGDVFTFSRRLEKLAVQNPVIAFDTWHSITKVLLDGNEIYSSGQELADRGVMLGAARHTIALPQNYENAVLTIELTATEINSMFSITGIGYYDQGDPAGIWYNRPVFVVVIGLLFLFIGTIIIVTSFVFARETAFMGSQLSLGAAVYLTGIYTMCRGNFLELFIENPMIYNTAEFLSIFVIPLVLLVYAWPDASCCDLLTRIFYVAVLLVNVVFLFCAIVLNFTTEIHFTSFQPVYYADSILSMAALIIMMIRCNRKEKVCGEDNTHRRMFFWGLSCLIASGFLAMLCYNLCYYPEISVPLRLWDIYSYILPFGMCLMSVFLVIDFSHAVRVILQNNYRNQTLDYLAHTDALTCLFNRRSFEEDLEALRVQKKGYCFGIVSIDLNGLKAINDQLGHEVGDDMLKSFAAAFQKACAGAGKPYRIGGDEFVTILKHGTADSCAEFVRVLQQEISLFNEEAHAYPLSAACGYAAGTECSKVRHVLREADQQMYSRKAAMKSEVPGKRDAEYAEIK